MKLSTIVKDFIRICALTHTLPSSVYAFSVQFRSRLDKVVVLPKDHLFIAVFATFIYKIEIAVEVQAVFYFIGEIVLINPRKFE